MSTKIKWQEINSQTFIDYGRYFVPARAAQIDAIVSLIPPQTQPFTVLELGCGVGLLAEAILQRHPQATVLGLDGSDLMRRHASERLAAFGDRFHAAPFDLFARDWRSGRYQAIVSSLTIHHLDGAGKQQLFGDAYAMLDPSGAFVIADLVLPLGEQARQLAATAWDTAVRHNAQRLDGNLDAYDYFADKEWNIFIYPDPMDRPDPIYDQLTWLAAAGFRPVEVYWMQAGHAIYGGVKPANSDT